jgi:putative aldouronate transport system substrate-binding protein
MSHKRIFAVFATLAAALMTTTALAQDLRILTAVTGGKDAAEHELFVQELEKHLGLDIEMIKPEADYNNVMFTSLASGEKFDLIYGDSSMIPNLVNQGAIMDVTDLVKGSAVLSDVAVIPAAEWDLFDMDGKLYGVPNKFEGGTQPTVRQDWLDEWGMATPVTLDDWRAYFEKAKAEKDAYGLSTAGLYDIQGFMSAAGVKYGYVTDADGKRTIPYATEAAAPIYDWFAGLSRDGLLDPNFATNGSGDFRNLFMSDRVAAVTYWDAWVGLFNNIMTTEHPGTTFKAAGTSGVPGPDGKVILRRGNASLWFIPANAEHVDNAMKFLEFWHSEPGYVLGTLGIEGHDYTVENGQYVLTEVGKSHSMDHGAPRVASTTWKNPFGALPGVDEAQAIIMETASVEYMPAEWTDAKPIVDNYAFQAMTGEITGAEAVAKMQEELRAAGLID